MKAETGQGDRPAGIPPRPEEDPEEGEEMDAEEGANVGAEEGANEEKGPLLNRLRRRARTR